MKQTKSILYSLTIESNLIILMYTCMTTIQYNISQHDLVAITKHCAQTSNFYYQYNLTPY